MASSGLFSAYLSGDPNFHDVRLNLTCFDQLTQIEPPSDVTGGGHDLLLPKSSYSVSP